MRQCCPDYGRRQAVRSTACTMARSSCGKDTRTPVGERGHFGVVGSANDVKALSDQRRDVGVSLGDCSEPLPIATGRFDIADAHSRRRSPSSRLRMNVESTVTVITAAAVVGWSEVTVPSCAPIRSVWLRNVSGLRPPSMGSRCRRTPESTRQVIRAEETPAICPAQVSNGNAMANRRSSLCDCRRSSLFGNRSGRYLAP
jgi:hypothetical protein